MWRIRAHVDNDKEEPAFEFQVERFLPREDPLVGHVNLTVPTASLLVRLTVKNLRIYFNSVGI